MDNNAEAVKIARSLTPIIEQTVRRMTENCIRSKLYTVSTAPDGSVIGVQDAFDTHEMLIPYSTALTNASVGDAVWCTWTGSNQSTMVAMWTGNVVSTTEVPKQYYVKLWENTSPTSSFAAQTIPLSLSGWSWIAIDITANTNNSGNRTDLCKVGEDTILTAQNYGSSQYVYMRKATVSTSGVTFSTGYRNTTGTTGTNYCIPLAIYGVY